MLLCVYERAREGGRGGSEKTNNVWREKKHISDADWVPEWKGQLQVLKVKFCQQIIDASKMEFDTL